MTHSGRNSPTGISGSAEDSDHTEPPRGFAGRRATAPATGTESSITGPFNVLPGCRLWLSVRQTGHTGSMEGVDRLSRDDRLRWERYRTPEKRDQFLQSRVLITQVLNQEAASRNSALNLARSETGRPVCLDAAGSEALSLSVSHSHGVCAVAVCDLPDRTGVDIETLEPVRWQGLLEMLDINWPAVRGRAKSDEEVEELARMAWLVREAVWKADPVWNPGRVSDLHSWLESRYHPAEPGLVSQQLFHCGCAPVIGNSLGIVMPAGASFRGCLIRRQQQ